MGANKKLPKCTFFSGAGKTYEFGRRWRAPHYEMIFSQPVEEGSLEKVGGNEMAREYEEKVTWPVANLK
jgi:hypothetical protein